MKNKNIWITGASSGIGAALSKEFASKGNDVILSSRSNEKLERLSKELKEASGNTILYPLDVSNINNVEEVSSEIINSHGVNCLINNAGTTAFKLAIEHDIKEVKNIIDTNLLGAIYTIKSVLPYMIEKKEGTIINTISVTAFKVFTHSSVYAASKAGLAAFASSLREEVRKYNIRIINIFPGAVSTPIWTNKSLEKFSERMMKPNDLAKFIYKIYEENSSVTPEDVIVRPILGDL